jgi:predicted Zn-dependent protease
LLSLKFSRNDESDADLVGLELAARAGFNPQAAVSLWRKMGQATGEGGIGFLSTHPTGPDRIRQLEGNVPRVMGLYEQARRR